MADKQYRVICPKCDAGGADRESHRPTCHVCKDGTRMMPADDLHIMRQMLDALQIVYIDYSKRGETLDENGKQYADFALVQAVIRNAKRRIN